MAAGDRKRTLIHKKRSIEITVGAKDNKERLTIDGKDVPFLKHANGKYYSGLLPYSQFDNPESLAKSLIESHPSFKPKPEKAKPSR